MKKIGAGLVGAGWMGSTLLKRLHERDDVEILTVCEANAERGREALAARGLPESILCDDYAKIVENPEIDAVWLVSPNSFHAQQAIAALNAGKHVFCEKPCATTFADYRALIEAERAHPELITYVDYILYFDTMEARLKEMIDSGEFGKILQIQVNYRHPINIAGDKVWKLKKNIMGDAIGMGINHAVFLMAHLMAGQGHPVGVFATSLPAQVRGFEVDPIWNIMVRYSSGATGFCFANIDTSNGFDAGHNISGVDGAFVYDSLAERPLKVRYWSGRSTEGKWVYPLDADRCRSEGLERVAWPEGTTTPDSGDVMQHQTHECVAHFIECVKSGKKSPLGFANSAAVAEIGWAAQMSSATGKEVALPLDFEQAEDFFAASP